MMCSCGGTMTQVGYVPAGEKNPGEAWMCSSCQQLGTVPADPSMIPPALPVATDEKYYRGIINITAGTLQIESHAVNDAKETDPADAPIVVNFREWL